MPRKAMASISRKQNSPFWFIQFILTFALSLYAQVPPLLSYQGRLTAAGTNFNGQTQFKFALVNGSGTVTFWSNDNSSSGHERTARVFGEDILQLGPKLIANLSLGYDHWSDFAARLIKIQSGVATLTPYAARPSH